MEWRVARRRTSRGLPGLESPNNVSGRIELRLDRDRASQSSTDFPPFETFPGQTRIIRALRKNGVAASAPSRKKQSLWPVHTEVPAFRIVRPRARRELPHRLRD